MSVVGSRGMSAFALFPPGPHHVGESGMGLINPPSEADFGARRSRTLAARVAATYLGFGLVWIWFSDIVMLCLGLEVVPGFLAGAIKGSLFVCLSAGLVFWLIRRDIKPISRMASLARTVIDSTTDAVYVAGQLHSIA